ncbi:SHOCT domain-containing protein [Amycolatopsis sp.]|uniref:SHOCT domain-containing protein n=1 Tax=Amycolatopsis sp. TaxID=37632 RepID=UPI002C7FAEE8|nr:SHOCT domain-containing protein [Amycolatopsis sp.]HVV14535.1 SHOCT domain-containing protein [Amycolatopsis sp.]
MVLAQSGTGYPFLDVMWTMLVFFGWVTWFWLLIVIFGDLFRRTDISGWGKAGWTVLVLVLPFVGVLCYLIAQGRHLGERRKAEAEAARIRFDDQVRAVAAAGPQDGGADEIARAKKLLDDGTIDDGEYQTLKSRALAR